MFKQVKHIRNLLRFAKGNHQPVFGPVKAAWEVINTCNAKCKTCLRWKEKPDSQILSTEEGKHLIKELADAGAMNLLFSGGEPLQRKDVYELIACAKQHKLFTTLMTNGLLINERRANRIVESGLDSIYISLDGSTRELNDDLRGIDGYFDLAIETIENIKAYRRNRRPKIYIAMTVNKANMYDIENMARFVKMRSLDGLTIQPAVHAPTVAYKVDTDLRLDGRDARPLQSVINRVFRLYGPYLTMSKEYYQQFSTIIENSDLTYQPQNIAGFAFVTIDARGNIYPDPMKTEKMGNVREESFKEIWYGRRAHEIRDRIASGRPASQFYDGFRPFSVTLRDFTPFSIPRTFKPIFKTAEHC